MSAVLEARAVITAEDRTKAAFDAIKAKIAGLTKQVQVMDRVMGTVAQAARSVDAVSGPTERVALAMSRMTDSARSISTVSAAMSKVERSTGAMATSLDRSTAEVAKLSSELFQAGGKLRAIADFKGANRTLDEASLAMRRSQQDVRRLKIEIAGMEAPSKSMQGALASAQVEAARAAEAFKLEGAAAREARAALDEFGIPLNRLRSEEERLKAAVESTTVAIRQQVTADQEAARAADALARGQAQAGRLQEKAAQERHRQAERDLRDAHMLAERQAHGVAHEGFMRFALTNAALAVGAGEVVNLGQEAWHKGAELQHERIGLQNAGRTPEELRDIEAAARKVISALPTASFTESMKVVAETTQAFGSVEHAVGNLPFMTKTMAVLKAAGGEHIQGSAGDVGRYLAKTFEERQTRPEDFQKEASMMIPAMVASGGVFNPEQLYAFAQQAKSSLPTLSMHFLSRIAPSVIGAMGGERAGTALNAFESVISGKANDKKQDEEWLKLGLLDPSQAIMKAGHAMSWRSGAVKDTFLAMSDPLAWAEKYLIPALQKQGVDTNSREQVKKVLDTMFRNQNANVFASEMTQAASRAILHKDAGLTDKVGDLDSLHHHPLADFTVAAGALKDSLGTLASAATAPMMRNTASSLTWLAGVLNHVAVLGMRHPTMAAGAGALAMGGALYGAGRISYAIMNGFGLKGSAMALDNAAAHLMEVGGPGGGWGGKAAGAAGAAGGAVTAAEGTGTALAIPETATAAAAAVALIGAAAVTELVKKSFEAQEPGKGGQWAAPTMATEDLDRQRLADQKAAAADLEQQIRMNEARSKLPGGADPINLPLRTSLAEKRNQIAELEKKLAHLHAFGPELPQGWLPKSKQILSNERFGPDLPPLPDTDRAERARASDGRGLARSGWGSDGSFASLPDAGLYGSADVPLPLRSIPGSRSKDDDAFHSRPSSGAPVPVSIVSAPAEFHQVDSSAERMPTRLLPPGTHADFTLGNNSGGFGSPGLGADDHLTPFPGHHAPHFDVADAHAVDVQVDDSALITLDQKLAETHGHMKELGDTAIAPHVDMGAIDALIAKLMQAKQLAASLGSGPGGRTSGSLGPSYPAAAPTGRMGGIR